MHTVALRFLLGCAFAALPLSALADAWRQDAYLWQRARTPELTQVLAESSPRLAGYYPLAGEIAWRAGKPVLTRVAVDYAALRTTGRKIGPVLRIGNFGGSFNPDDEIAGVIKESLRWVLANARASGVEPAEVQVDFDCSENKLAGYRVWIEMLKREAGGVPLVFTALPAWLDREADFAALTRAADGYVLQVHSLEKPRGGPDAPYALCEPEKALEWAQRAAKAGRPFRVALPTYGYRLAFDEAGKFIGLSADGPTPRWREGAQLRIVRTDPLAMLKLARDLKDAAPAHCEGVVWFRHPVPGERLNWDAATFNRVISGEAPRRDLQIEARAEAGGLVSVWLVNRGETAEALPARVKATWAEDARLAAFDGLGGYRVEQRSPRDGVVFSADAVTAEVTLAPGRSRQLGWLRFPDEISVHVSLD